MYINIYTNIFVCVCVCVCAKFEMRSNGKRRNILGTQIDIFHKFKVKKYIR